MMTPRKRKSRVIEAAARLIRNDSRQLETFGDYYPLSSTMSSEQSADFLRESLSIFWKNLVQGNETALQEAAIGQAIVQAARPRSIHSPLQLGLGIQLHQFSSRFLIKTLHAFGFCCSYGDVLRFSWSAAKQ